MDRNSLIGVGLIGAILIGWMLFTGPNKAELAAKKRIADSIALADSMLRVKETEKLIAASKIVADSAKLVADTSKTVINATPLTNDSLKAVIAAKIVNDTYRDFAASATGTDSLYIIENNFIRAFVSSKGAKIVSVELKQYNRPNEPNPLVLFNGDSLIQSLEINAYNSIAVSTDSLYFVPEKNESKAGPGKPALLAMRLKTNKANAYIDFVYKLKEDSYMLDYDVVFSNMESIVSSNRNDITLNWAMQLPSQELHIEKEKQTSGIFFQTVEPNGETEVDNMSLVSSEEKSIPESELKWVSFKQQFFSSVLIAKTKFIKGTLFNTYVDKTNSSVVKSNKAALGFFFEGKPSETFSMQFFYGPNQYHVLKEQNLELEQMIPMGWSVFKYLNKWLVIPIFSAFKDSSMSMGWVILILTLIIKILLLPIAYKTYLSSAKMRLLKPEIDAIKAKHGTDTMKVNQENMALYKRAGASPLSGCIPALLQLPILIALLNFFPASFELRQKEFLWATDLSTYDSVWDFGVIPIINSIYGDHMSMFALLMFVSTMVYTWMNQKIMPMNNQQMPGMQVMMYLMPVIFLSFMNSYSAGLSWYYFLANMITFLQTFLMRKLVSDDKLRAKIDQNMRKPAKKTGFQQRLEDMQKKQQLAAKKR